MKEFNCKATSTWSKCGREKETAFTHKHLSPKRQEESSWTTTLDQGEDTMKCTFAMMSERGQRGTTTLFFARRQEEEQIERFPKGNRKKKWTGWKPKTDEQRIEFRKKVMVYGDDKIDEDLTTIQKAVETAAGKVAHLSKADRETLYRVRRIMSDFVRKLLRDAQN